MHVTVAGKQVETGEALKTHVRDGLDAIARKYFDHALEAHVTFRRDAKGKAGRFFACDINLHAGRQITVRGEGAGTDAHRAFDEAAEHIAKRLRRYRRRVNDHARGLAGDRGETAAPEPATQYVLRREDEEADDLNGYDALADGLDGQDGALADGAEADRANGALDHRHGAIIAETSVAIERLTVGEAVMRMDLAHMPVMMFRNRATGALNVVYRRTDGHIGWIDPSPGH